MRKKYVAILLVPMLLLVLSCGNGSDTDSLPTDQYYVGSVNSDKYHYPSCRHAERIHSENEIWFKDKDDARRQGYVPCRVCKP